MLCIALLIGFFGLVSCDTDETVAAYGGADRVWTLTELDGAAFAPRATLTFPETGRIAGDAPCNSYRGAMDVPYPWFEVAEVVSTKMACPDLAAETEFLGALGEMAYSELVGDLMILTNDAGREMVFTASE